jgi:hypothetical protein
VPTEIVVVARNRNNKNNSNRNRNDESSEYSSEGSYKRNAVTTGPVESTRIALIAGKNR